MPGKVETVELLGRLSGGGPWGKKMGDKVGAPSSVAEGLVPGVGDGLPSGCFPLRRRRPEGLPEASI